MESTERGSQEHLRLPEEEASLKKSASFGDASVTGIPPHMLAERRGSKVRFSQSDLKDDGDGNSYREDDEFNEKDDVSYTGVLRNNSAIQRQLAKSNYVLNGRFWHSTNDIVPAPKCDSLRVPEVGRRDSWANRRSSITPSESDSVSKYHPRKRLSSKFQSLDYNVVESQRFLQDQEEVMPKAVQKAALTRWMLNFIIGLYVAIIAVLVALSIKYLSQLKFMAVYEVIKDCNTASCLIPGCLVWMSINMLLVGLGAYLVTYHAPQAAGSGIPQIKCYLNGIKLPGLLSLKTLLAKAGGVVLSVCGGLACGKEGPMIHSGAICASGMARGEFRCCTKKWSPKCCEPLRKDEERRDFVAAGAASGVSAAFASPVGGVLFSLEEGASFLNQMLTWRMLFSSMTASLFLNIIMSAIHGHPENMSNPGLISLGYIGDISFKTIELPIFMLMACVGGLSGALFVQINYKITLFRRRIIKKNWMKVAEAVFVAGMSAVILMMLIYMVPDCQPIRQFNATKFCAVNGSMPEIIEYPPGHGPVEPQKMNKRSVVNLNDTYDYDMDELDVVPHLDEPHHDVHGGQPEGHQDEHDGHEHGHNPYGFHGDHGYTFRGFCPCGYHNRMADILFKTPEGGLHAMLHQPYDEWNFTPLLVLLISYHLLATWTYGLMVSSGVFIPSLLIGAITGRMIGMVVIQFIPSVGTSLAKYALIGAACNLGGTVRMTISLTVIIIECTGDITFGIPIMLSLIIAKWMGDFFTPGIYDIHIEIMGVPLLPWEPPEMTNTIRAREVMNSPVECLRTQEKIGRIAKILNDPESHNGFPVVDDYDPDSSISGTYGRLKGFILKSQLKQILMAEGEDISPDEYDSVIDLRMHMDRAPYSIQDEISLPRVFKLFRGLGLRHLIVVTDRNRVAGVITRINLARFRGEMHKGHFKLEELEVADS
ncbi:hypothetical protein CAPTEDRAFT_203043 [Capitella teleta]|uniref:Chloride channel protein n=1 Tax=Capitella teleta TaxID=283909 RepID=R7TZP9_CAPTE|nr:hypothetical protein CAPTEDRAFT_203043 [Capitella teleta]|eukprot:ELT96405.1 hypothetical protein CAPTEDRAFT_203043 [Capitella teleta]